MEEIVTFKKIIMDVALGFHSIARMGFSDHHTIDKFMEEAESDDYKNLDLGTGVYRSERILFIYNRNYNAGDEGIDYIYENDDIFIKAKEPLRISRYYGWYG